MNFIEDLKTNNIIVDDVAQRNFEIFYNELVETNKITNLTRIIDKEDVYYFHFYDSLMVLKAIENKNGYLLDVGAGPGFPSLPLKIQCPSLNIDIVEATNKKVEFIKHIINKLDLKNINPIHSRAEDYKEFNKYDYITTRAVSKISEQLEYTIPFLKIGGSLIAMKSLNSADEEINNSKELLKRIGAVLDKKIEYKVKDRDYCLVVIKKIKETPKGYPKAIHKEKK